MEKGIRSSGSTSGISKCEAVLDYRKCCLKKKMAQGKVVDRCVGCRGGECGVRGTGCITYIYEIVKEKVKCLQGNKITLSGERVSRHCRIQLGWFIGKRGRVRQNRRVCKPCGKLRERAGQPVCCSSS